MLDQLGVGVSRFNAANASVVGKFAIDDGEGHAYALIVGEHCIMSFCSGFAELITTQELGH
eukprot:7150861-Pyramimonas_sp.AAC.1